MTLLNYVDRIRNPIRTDDSPDLAFDKIKRWPSLRRIDKEGKSQR